MTMRAPKSVLVDGKKWRVVRRSLRKSRKLDGQCNHGSKTLVISWGLNNRQMTSTLFHEVIHASTPDLNEEAVLRMEAALMNALDGTLGYKNK